VSVQDGLSRLCRPVDRKARSLTQTCPDFSRGIGQKDHFRMETSYP